MIVYYLIKISYFFATRLPLRVGYAIATFLSLVKFYLSPRDRMAVLANLRKILPASEQGRIQEMAKEVFINFGKYLIEFFRFKYLKKEDLGSLVTIKGLEHVKHALKGGKGAIFMAAHMGNWELGGVFMSLLGYPMVAVALPHRHPKVNSFFNHQRSRIGVQVVPSMGTAIRRVYSALKANKLVAIVSDRDFLGGGIKMDFLGAEKIMPRGAAVLAGRTGAPIIPAFVIRRPDDTHVLEFLKPLNTQASEEEIVREGAKVIESIIRRYPAQWLMFREFWKE